LITNQMHTSLLKMITATQVAYSYFFSQSLEN